MSAIAADAVGYLSALYPPGHTSLHVVPAKVADNDFAAAFEDKDLALADTIGLQPGVITVTAQGLTMSLDKKTS
mgnify:CR=1 FL=1